MQLSDAITLGSVSLVVHRGTYFNADRTGGCAFGMALKGIGRDKEVRNILDQSVNVMLDSGVGVVGKEWPWLFNQLVAYPCSCFADAEDRAETAFYIITHLFDDHVMGKNDMTLDWLVSFVRAIEPKKIVKPIEIEKELVEVLV